MLILTRNMNQSINVGTNVTIRVLEIKGRSVRIGIEAPGEVRIMRAEIDEQRPEDADDQ
jgi:carbon storage regulator